MPTSLTEWIPFPDVARLRPLFRRNRLKNLTGLENRIEVVLRGGLGNQLFAFAAGRGVSLRNRLPLHLVTRFLGVTNTSGRPFELAELAGGEVSFGQDSSALRTFREASFAWDSRVEMLSSPVLLDGFFQSAKYFRDVADEVRNEVAASSSFSRGRSEAPDEPFLAVQIRRGDYLNLDQKRFHGLLPENYFLEGLAKLREMMGALPAVIYSDDFETAKAVADQVRNAVPHRPTVGRPALQTLGSMSSASGFCISNSSFGWWGAYMCETQPPVIAPRPWFADPKVQTHDLLEPSWFSLGFVSETTDLET